MIKIVHSIIISGLHHQKCTTLNGSLLIHCAKNEYAQIISDRKNTRNSLAPAALDSTCSTMAKAAMKKLHVSQEAQNAIQLFAFNINQLNENKD